ncbi:MAG: DUF5672 family protein [Blastocatellales bacterium]
MNQRESVSYAQCLSVLARHNILLLAPKDMDLSKYQEEDNEVGSVRVPGEWLASHAAYDRMMLDPMFYEIFRDYKYILIYQLDAFVFSDELNKWCETDIDYVGAPWVDRPDISRIASDCTRIRRIFNGKFKRFSNLVGNGGLSLRKVKTFYNNLNWFRSKAKTWPYYEDTFFSFFLTSYNPFFRIPDFNTALNFAFETNPSKCFELNQKRLPFGCHGWDKYEPEFWKPIFRQYGYEIEIR